MSLPVSRLWPEKCACWKERRYKKVKKVKQIHLSSVGITKASMPDAKQYCTNTYPPKEQASKVHYKSTFQLSNANSKFAKRDFHKSNQLPSSFPQQTRSHSVQKVIIIRSAHWFASCSYVWAESALSRRTRKCCTWRWMHLDSLTFDQVSYRHHSARWLTRPRLQLDTERLHSATGSSNRSATFVGR